MRKLRFREIKWLPSSRSRWCQAFESGRERSQSRSGSVKFVLCAKKELRYSHLLLGPQARYFMYMSLIFLICKMAPSSLGCWGNEWESAGQTLKHIPKLPKALKVNKWIKNKLTSLVTLREGIQGALQSQDLWWLWTSLLFIKNNQTTYPWNSKIVSTIPFIYPYSFP